MLHGSETIMAFASFAAIIILFLLATFFWIIGIVRNQRRVIIFSMVLLVFVFCVAVFKLEGSGFNLSGCFLILHGIASLVLSRYIKETGIISKKSLSALGIGFLIFGVLCGLVM